MFKVRRDLYSDLFTADLLPSVRVKEFLT